MNTIIFTTTAFSDGNNWQRVRIDMAYKLVENATKKGYEIIIIDHNSEEKYISRLRKLGGKVFSQENIKKGVPIGVARREALDKALGISLNEDDFLLWTEPEKYPIIADIEKLATKMRVERTALGMFNRKNLKSYPPEQQLAYKFPRLASNYFLNKDLDFMFGPVLFKKSIAGYWQNYEGSYEDKWDSIHIPKLRAILSGTEYSVIDSDYVHPTKQTEAEKGNKDLFMKRLEQANLICNAIVQESEKNSNKTVDATACG